MGCGVWIPHPHLCAGAKYKNQETPPDMKISEVVVKAPRGPLTPAQGRIYALKGRVKAAQDTLKNERESQRRQRETERARKALAALNQPKPA